MQQPELVADCVRAMQAACSIPVTVKCRTGIVIKNRPDEYHDLAFLERFVDTLVDAGCSRLCLLPGSGSGRLTQPVVTFHR